MSLSGGKSQKKNVTSQTNTLDPYMEQLRRQFGDAASAAAGGPAPTLDPSIAQAMGIFGGLGNLGLGAGKILGGDADAIKAAMNPYLTNVTDALGSQYDKMAGKTSTALKQQAAQAGAYGGSRHGVAEGVALGELRSNQGQQIAGLLKGGYDDVMSRALQTANLGLNAGGALSGLGQYVTGFNEQNNPAMRRFSILGQALGLTPYTTNSKGRSTQTGWEISGEGKMPNPFKWF